MTETRIKINSIIENQLPQFIIEEFPLISEFLSQYYVSLESKGGANDVLQNVDQYIKVDNLTNLTELTSLTEDVNSFDSVIKVESTLGFPNSYGLLLIDSEIITYTSKTSTTFEGCIRGFSGVTSYTESYDELSFSESQASDHFVVVDGNNTLVLNLSILFLKEFLYKIKKQFIPGFENRELYPDLNQNIFIKQSIDFYSSKGTDNSFKILFSALYKNPVEIIKPRDYLIKASSSQYRITSDLVVESIQGDPNLLVNKTLRQDKTDFINNAQGTITKVEKIRRGSKDYYILSLDSDYDKDIQSLGTLFGKFSIHPKTKVTSQINSGSTVLNVDSTVAFPKKGSLSIELDNGTDLEVSYTSKTLNQFLGCSGIIQNIPEYSEIKSNLFAYGYANSNEIRVRILGTLSDIPIPENTKLYSVDDKIKIKTLGINSKNHKLNNWFFNIPTKYEIKNVQLNDISDWSYEITTYDDHFFNLGDSVTVFSSSGAEQIGSVFQFINQKSIKVRFGFELDSISAYIKKNISNPSFTNYPLTNVYTSNVQNVYYENDDTFYVASPSLPSYRDDNGKDISLMLDDRSITISGTFFPDDENGTILTSDRPHNLYTGDSVVYKPSLHNNLGISSGIYYIKKIDSFGLKLSRSKDNIFSNKFISIDAQVSSEKLELSEFTYRNLKTQVLESQKLIRQISTPKNDNLVYDTIPGTTGIFVNGVELLNYKSKDNVYYGPIQEIIPTSPGSEYDVINPPILNISDLNGTGAIGHCSVIGKLERIDIIDPGFDYLEDPVIDIKGGNGNGAIAKTNLVSFDHIVSFDSQSSAGVKIFPSNQIKFFEPHKFRDAEEVVYVTNGQAPIVGGISTISGISTNSTYYVSIQDAFNIKLHKSLEDAIAGINTFKLTSYGIGNHAFKSKNKKKKIGSIFIENSGYNYQNKLTIANYAGINTATNTIYIKDHKYSDGEIVVYNATEVAVGGLSSSRSYYVTKIDNNQFKLSEVGDFSVGVTSSFYYDSKQYVNLTSSGSGSHKFNYPEITVSVKGKIGVSSAFAEDYKAILRPIFRGSIQSVFLESGGSSYGSGEIINYNRQPSYSLNSGSGIEIKPIILEGKITKVLINSPGSGYNSIPNVNIIGTGSGAILTPIFSNGTLSEVKVIYGGSGYDKSNTFIEVIPSGKNAKFEFKIKPWKINQVKRLLGTKSILDNIDDGILTTGLNSDYGLQYTHAYASRLLRSLVYGNIFEGGKNYYPKDLQKQGLSENEIDSNAHSPIIGWAYDGNPIYGPYGYAADGSIKQLISGYSERSSKDLNRPPESLYPFGFFIDDYEFTGNGDLDEHNGRFCITPEYPNGVYAYFATIKNGLPYKIPTFPYVIGPSYKSKPIEFNFIASSNQDFIDLNETQWIRNTTPYNILNNNFSYDYILNPNKIKPHDITITNISSGKIDSIGILTGGKNYKINDKIIFEGNAKASVSKIKGKSVLSIKSTSTSIDDVEFIRFDQQFLGFATSPHNYSNNTLITFTGQFDYKKSGTISVNNNILTLTSGVGSATYTGIITYFNVSGNLAFPYIRENDIYQIGNEQVKILNVDRNFSKIKVIRNQNGTVGIVSYSTGSRLRENPRKFSLNFGISTSYNLKSNKEIYFNPQESVGFGTGSTHTLFLSLKELNNQVSIGTGSTTTLYFTDLKDIQIYENGGYVDLKNSSNPSFDCSKKKIVSIGKTSIGIDFDTTSLSGIGVISYLSKWDIKSIATRSLYLPNHGLETGDRLTYKLNGGTSILFSDDGINTYGLFENDSLYSVKISDDFVGVSTVKVGLDSTSSFVGIGSTVGNILYFISSGTGNNHSFKTNYSNTLKGQISNNLVTVSTTEPHKLSLLDNVDIKIKSTPSVTYVIKYDDHNRRLLVNPKPFSSIDTASSIIKIDNHGFYHGQKIIYTSNSPSIGLENNGIYYVVLVNSNKIRLANSYYEATKDIPNTIDILTSSFGYISPINPPIEIIKNKSIEFDLSHSSLSFKNGSTDYSAFEFKIYEDENFINEFVTSNSSEKFDVIRTGGEIGKDSSAKLILSFGEKTPKNLYYNLIPINLSKNSQFKKEIVVDKDVIGFNKISIKNSIYEGNYNIVGVSSTSFNYNVLNVPESTLYTDQIEYYTNSKTAQGPIYKILISDRGNYKKLPKISHILSKDGTESILEPISDSIGKVLSLDVQDIGFDYSSDYTIRPTAKLPDVLKLEPLTSFDYIQILSSGKNYFNPPSLVVIDGSTNKVISDVELKYSIGDSLVTIVKNTQSINNVTPKIFPINNSNGIKIKNIVYNNITKNVIVTLNASFSNPEDYPFKIGTKILVEGVSVGVGSTGKGFNSADYNYELFKLNAVTPSLGGSISTISYSLSAYLKNGETPGLFNPTQSFGRVIPESYLPSFKSYLKKNDFYKNETVYTQSSIGMVESWDLDNQVLKVSSEDTFKINELILGKSSGSIGIIREITSYDLDSTIDSYTEKRKGWNNEIGFLNNDLQRIHDSDYYQYFSYSLKSKKDLSTWEDSVNSLNHTAGFKKFANLIIESDTSRVGISSTEQNQGDVSSTVDFSNVININCTFDFDLAKENSFIVDENLSSNEIIFNSKIIQDYIESIGNRVLTIDDISTQFNSELRSSKFSIIDSFDLEDFRSKKYIISVQNQNFLDNNEQQISLVSLLHNNTIGFVNQYGTYTSNNLGFFDFIVSGKNGNLTFYPIDPDYSSYYLKVFSFNLNDTISGIGSTNLGNSVLVSTANTTIPELTISPTTITGISSSYRSGKILVQIGSTNSSYYEYDEIIYIHNGTDVEILDYGQLSTNSINSRSTSGIGSYNAYISGENVKIDLIPYTTNNVAYNINTFNIFLGDDTFSGTGSKLIGGSLINSFSTSIGSSSSPSSNIICSYSNLNSDYNCSYSVISIEDKTNSQYQISEFFTITTPENCQYTEYAILQTNSNVGILSAGIIGSNTNVYFTPIPNIETNIKVFQVSIGLQNDADTISFNNGSIDYKYDTYVSRFSDIKKSFNLTHKNLPIFYREFNGSDPNIVDIQNNLFTIPNNFYNTGEEIEYFYDKKSQPIGIATTSIIGIGVTDKLPSKLYVVKFNNNKIRVAVSASEALFTNPNVLKITSVGFGTNHIFKSKNQNKKVLISIDNVIQSPIVSTSITTLLKKDIGSFDVEIPLNSVNSIFSGDFIKIDNEIMKVTAVGVASTNSVSVIRPWFGTGISSHYSSSLVKKITGDYNIVENVINFVSPPYGNVPNKNPDNPSEVDYVGISTGSTFNGRVFLKSGITNTEKEPYQNNYIFDSISNEFDGIQTDFTLKSDGLNVSGISTDNIILLLKEVFQGPGILGDYDLIENSGITTVSFVGGSTLKEYDVNIGNVPRGGIILSVGSSQGFGYQPLISAGGTAVVSASGTIQSISIGNSGSGYRTGIQTTINVSVVDSSSNIKVVGIASASNGYITNVTIINPGTGYTSSNPPSVIFDSPLSYSNIPLIYSSKSSIGVGTGAYVDIIVGQGSSVVSFEIKNFGYAYKPNEILTVPINGFIGIPTYKSYNFSEFQILVDTVHQDKFSAWSIGNLQIIDPIENLFDGFRKVFPISINGNRTTIRAKKGSDIDVQSTLLVFINDILQVPGKSYTFKGGSIITFIEAPKKDDLCKILFYGGTKEVDTSFVDILENIKTGDKVTLISNDINFTENERLVTDIISSDTLETNLYQSPGISRDENLLRPVVWCRQTDDLIINGEKITKNRTIYEPYIQPSTNIIANVGISTNIIFVDSVKGFFDSEKEYVHDGTTEKPQNKIIIIDQNSLTSASGTAIVSSAGTISSINIFDGGSGYSTSPSISIGYPIGIGSFGVSKGYTSITNGIVTSVAISTGGYGYDPLIPPVVLFESPTLKYEVLDNISYTGDFGIISGFSTTSVGIASTGIIFDFYIPNNSILKDQKIVNPIIQTSGIQTGYYFVIRKSNIGNGIVSLNSLGQIVGIGTTFIDNIYQVASVSIAQTSVPGIGLTNVAKVTVNVSNYNGLSGIGYSSFYGEYSWGIINTPNRINPKQFISNNLGEISTSPIVQRFNRLKYVGYST